VEHGVTLRTMPTSSAGILLILLVAPSRAAFDPLSLGTDLACSACTLTANAIEAQLVAATDKAKSDKDEFEQETKRLKESHKQTVATLNEKIDEMSTQMTALRSRAADGDLAVAKANELQEELDRVHRDHEKIIAQQTEEARVKMRREIRRAQDEANNRVALARMDCDQIVAKIKKKNQQLLERWQKEQALRRKYYNQLEDMKGKIRVYARVRPLSKKELKMKVGPDGSAAPWAVRSLPRLGATR